MCHLMSHLMCAWCACCFMRRSLDVALTKKAWSVTWEKCKKNTSNTPTIATMWRYTPLLYNYYERNTALMPPIMLFVFATLLGPAR